MLDVQTDPDLSAAYRELVDGALAGRVLDGRGRFCCPSGTACKGSVRSDGFAPGQLPYVGDHYAAESGGQSVRILVVTAQVGASQAPLSLSRRREVVHAAIPQPFAQRPDDLAAVTTALRILFGGGPGDDPTGEALATGSGPVHVLDACALTASALCSRLPASGRAAEPTNAMLVNCGQHLYDTVAALEPTIIHTQGRSPGSSPHHALERLADTVAWVDDHVARIHIAGVDAIWCSLADAAEWSGLDQPHLLDAAVPALRKARALALAAAG